MNLDFDWRHLTIRKKLEPHANQNIRKYSRTIKRWQQKTTYSVHLLGMQWFQRQVRPITIMQKWQIWRVPGLSSKGKKSILFLPLEKMKISTHNWSNVGRTFISKHYKKKTNLNYIFQPANLIFLKTKSSIGAEASFVESTQKRPYFRQWLIPSCRENTGTSCRH